MASNSIVVHGVLRRSIPQIARLVPVWVSITILALMCTGCISLVDERLGTDGKAGWIVKRYTLDELRTHRPTCLVSVPAESIEMNQYVEVSVAKGRGRRYVAAMLPASIRVQVGDQVEVAPHRCENGQVPVVKQILKRRG